MMNPNRFRMDARTIFIFAALIGAGSMFITSLTGESIEVLAEETANDAPREIPEAKVETTPATPVAARKAGGCLSDEDSIKDFQDMKRELAKKDQDLKHREEEIAAKERALEEELKKLDKVRDEIKLASGIGDAKGEEKISKLAETFESMNPKAAAAIVITIDERLAVEAMTRLSSTKLGKILAAMDPNKSGNLAEKIAGVVRAKRSETRNTASLDVAETSKSVKGGEENGNRKQSSTDAISSRQPEPALGREPASEKR